MGTPFKVTAHSRRGQMSEDEIQAIDEGIKLYGEWSFEGIEVRDIGLKRYINLDPVYLPHSGGRHEARKFRKSNLNIVERLINNLMKPGSSGGEKSRINSAVKTAFNNHQPKDRQKPNRGYRKGY